MHIMVVQESVLILRNTFFHAVNYINMCETDEWIKLANSVWKYLLLITPSTKLFVSNWMQLTTVQYNKLF